MEKVSEILNSIKERLSNPLIFSFIVSWLVYNWEITIALLWYDKTQFKAEGFKSVFEFVQHQLDTKCWSMKWPILLAVIYTFGMPYFKEFVDLMNKKAILFGKKWKTKLLKDDLLLQISNLEDKLNSINNATLLNGDWRLIRHYQETTSTGSVVSKSDESQIYIIDKDYYIVENASRKMKYYISDFYFNPITKDMLFKLSSYGNKSIDDAVFIEKDIICSLKLDNGYWNNLSGMHNDVRVEYKKI
ncbi:hypothetical protein [Flavobacterium sp.]|uniref:hypothetical protein n=1 Tax=Flavobacterium sp. TaxID=239 RepID=UPI002FD8EF69